MIMLKLGIAKKLLNILIDFSQYSITIDCNEELVSF